jgi:hypothetical protein
LANGNAAEMMGEKIARMRFNLNLRGNLAAQAGVKRLQAGSGVS